MEDTDDTGATNSAHANDEAYVSNYEVQLSWPAVVLAAATEENAASNRTTASSATASPPKPPRTSDELIQMRLLEARVLFEVPVTLGETVERLDDFCRDLEKTGCFNKVSVQVGGGESVSSDSGADGAVEQELRVILDEKAWYRLHLGGGVKAQELLETAEQSAESGVLPMAAELEASVGLRNLAGCLDQSALSYRLDTKGLASWTLSHERPLYTFLPSPWRETLLETSTGSRYSLTAKAVLDTLDFEYSRSYKEYQRLVSVHLSNQHSLRDSPLAGAMIPEWYGSLSWSFLLRDVIPRRTVDSPWLSAASPSILQEAGPSNKNSFVATLRTNGAFLASDRGDQPVLNPTAGWQAYAEVEVATPPGDVSFAKVQTGLSSHLPVTDSLSLHWMGQAGFLKSPLWGGKGGATVSDRFHIGGPLQIPGFLPAGIGPRDSRGGSGQSLTPGGDSVGGDLYYRTTLMASLPAFTSVFADARAFGFLAAGTCVRQANLKDPLVDVLASTRASVGVGLATTALAGSRLEVTYAWPLRYAPVDARRNFQFGIGLSLG
jgi:hypothetical protein